MKYFSLISFLFCTSLTAQQTNDDIAWMAYTSGRYEEALTAIQQCIDRDTTQYHYYFLKGKTLENLYRYDEAIVAQQQALRLNPNSMESRAVLAALFFLSGQPSVSAQFYEELATAEPLVNRWKMSWATALLASGKTAEALEQLIMVEQTDSTNWLVYKNMGDCFLRLDSIILSTRYYYYALQLNPNNKNLWGTLTRLLATNDDELENAIQIGNEAVAIDSTNVEAWKYLGIAYYQFGDAPKAYHALRKTLALGDSTFTTVSHYGILNHHFGQAQANYYHRLDAEKYLEKAYKMRPRELNIMNYLAIVYGFNNKNQKGLDIIDEMNNIIANYDTIRIKAEIQRGYLLRRMGKYNEAVSIFINATKIYPKDIRIIYEVGICYDRAQNKKLAIDWYTRYLEKVDPNWANKKWTEQELKKFEFVTIAMDRIKELKVELFWEE